MLNRRIFTLFFAFGVTGCTTHHPPPHERRTMLIDKISADYAKYQIPLLDTDQYKEEQQALINTMEKLLAGKYHIVARRIHLLPPTAGIAYNSVRERMDFNNTIQEIDPDSKLVFENYTTDQPYYHIWRTGGPRPERAALVYYEIENKNTLLGFFELKPTQQQIQREEKEIRYADQHPKFRTGPGITD
jgi:hypothetical protein